MSVTLAVLAAVDASRQTDQVIWQPQQVNPNTAYATLTAGDLTAVTHRLGEAAVTPLIDTTHLSLSGAGTTDGRVAGILVPCGATRQLTRTAAPCGQPTVGRPAAISAKSVSISDSNGKTVSTGTEKLATFSAPAEVMGGTGTFLLPVPRTYLTDRLQHLSRDERVHAILTVHNPAELESLRNLTWHSPDDSIAGGDGSLSNILGKSDLLADGRYYADSFTALAMTLVGAGLCTAFLAATCSAAVEARVQRSQDAVLLCLGTTTGTLWRARLLATIMPLAIGAFLSIGAAGLLGYLYMTYVGYPQLHGILLGFPAATFLLFVLIETALLLVLSLGFQRLVTGSARTLNAAAHRVLNT